VVANGQFLNKYGHIPEPRKPTHNPAHLTTRRQTISPKPFHHNTSVESAGSSGVTEVSTPG
jgi:hypothetical protein